MTDTRWLLRVLYLSMALSVPVMAANEGMATHFLGIGYPYGACGVPDEVAANEAAIDTLTGQGNPVDYVALNVFHTPLVYTMVAARPMKGADTAYLGTYDNGRNCGRWLKLTLGDTCDGTNDGAAGKDFCRGGTGWYPNAHTGRTIHAIVFDQCTDGNAWCRDSKYHLDLHTPILGRLRKNGQLLPPMAVPALDGSGKPIVDPNNPWAIDYRVTGFNNPKVSWEFVEAPNYQGEPRFYFSMDSKAYYQRLIVTHLPNGLHGVEQLVGTEWKKATMQGDAGQQWLLPEPSGTSFTLRLTDVRDSLVMGGRTWKMDYPKACGTSCTKPATPADNVVSSGGIASRLPAPKPIDALPRQLADGSLRFPGKFDGRVQLAAMNGRELAWLPIHEGTAALPTHAKGLCLARWSGEGFAGSGIILLH